MHRRNRGTYNMEYALYVALRLCDLPPTHCGLVDQVKQAEALDVE